MSLFRQVRLLMWKNWLLQKRKICVTIFEVILPVFFALIFLVVRGLVSKEDFPDPTLYPTVNATLTSDYFQENTIIGYAPSNSETDLVMSKVDSIFQRYTDTSGGAFIKNYSMRSFQNEEEALDFFRYHSADMRHLIIFYDVTNTSTTLPQNIRFAVRPYTGSAEWETGSTFPFSLTNTPREKDSPSLYYTKGVIYMQRLVGQALIEYWNSSDVDIGVYEQRMAYPPYFNDPMITVLQAQLPLFLVLSFILSVIVNTKNLVYEKEQKLKESMKLMGLKVSAHWISWFLTFSSYLLPAIIIYSILFGIKLSDKGAILANGDPSLFFVFLLCYSLALISFCFMVSTFVQKANIGAALAGILFFAFFFPYYFITPVYETLDKNLKLTSGLLFNCAMALGAKVIGMYEGTGEGIQWNNFHKPATVDDNLTLLDCMIMLLVDTVIHLLITWYLDNVWPGEFGVPKPFYFCFKKSYWCGADRASGYGTEDSPDRWKKKQFEREPTDLYPGIQVKNLQKKFGLKTAVAGTSLNMFEGHITVLLGHNGAGKTTTMSMLTGFIPPSSGTAIVNGHDICDDIDGVRSSLGLCPQHNILFDTLTVKEHLEFFALLKGCSGSQVETEVMATIKEVGLENKAFCQSHGLSGGQKRKLSVGIALIGGSKVVILDEPTSGMDPGARRQTWNILQNAREGRTLVLSTHYMDEADLLGDRIAIMAEGVVKCCGSSMFLKKLYGAGYHLVVVKSQACDVNKLTDFIQSIVDSAELETVINTEVNYLLPHNESSKFASLFRELEKMKGQLGITSFGTSATTMEEVFLKVGEHAYDEDSSHHSENSEGEGYTNPYFNDNESSGPNGSFKINNKVNAAPVDDNDIQVKNKNIMDFNQGFTKNAGLLLTMSRFHGLFVKKAIHTWRNRVVTLVQLLLPVIFAIIGLAVSETEAATSADPPLTFTLQPFGHTYIPYTAGMTPSQSHIDFAQVYASQFSGHTLENFNLGQYDTFDNYTLERARNLGTATFNKEMVIGMEVVPEQGNQILAATSFYNGQPYHGDPIAMNMLMNTFLQNVLGNSYSLQSSVNPLPKDENEDSKAAVQNSLSAGFTIGFFLNFGMAFLTTMFIFFPIKERQVGAKHMQVVSGVGPFAYWIPTFAWDFINYIVPSLLLVIVFLAYQKTAYIGDGRWALVILVLVLYGWAVLPFMYALQFVFSSPPTGVVMVIMLNIVSGLVTTLVVFVLQIPGLGTEDIANSLNWVFMVLFPNYNMAQSFSNMYTNYLNLENCLPKLPLCGTVVSPCCPNNCNQLGSSFCTAYEEDYTSWDVPGIGSNLLFMTLQGLFFMCVVLFVEYQVFQKIGYLIQGSPNSDKEAWSYENRVDGTTEDNDVMEERKRLNHSHATGPSSSDSLALVNLFKQYGSFVAVDHICVGVPEQECFGLLGQNGAGKTTTFKMLTGDVMVTGGNAYLKGYDVRSDIKSVQANMGYCPQFDALIDQMTGVETLVMYARLRGVPEDKINGVVNSLIDLLMLRPHADKLASQYSGGNKRKLSTAIALVGDPPFIMLDEPSSGMDPKARRQLWNVLSQVRASGRTLVLTSHSMEECDALCTRIAIMVNGRFMCLGSPQHLKNKFGQGYTLIVQLGLLEDGLTAPNQPVVQFITERFQGAKVFDDHQGYIHFQVPDSSIKLADVFELMESTKTNLNVADYSVHQTTLEQVFLTFTRHQVIAEEKKKHGCCSCFK